MKGRLQIGIIILYIIATVIIADAQTLSFNKVPTREGEANLSVRQVIQDKNGFLWLATFNGLYRFEGDEYVIQHSFLNNREINNDVTLLIEDNNHNLWIGTNNGLLKYNIKTEKTKTYFHDKNNTGSISRNKNISIFIDKEGCIWIGTYDSGLNIYNPELESFEKIKFNEKEVKSPTHIKSILEDRNGKIWIGTLGDGVYFLTKWDTTMLLLPCNFHGQTAGLWTATAMFRLQPDS